MEPRLLFPSKFRYLGYLLAIPDFILGWLTQQKGYIIPGFELKIRSGSPSFPIIKDVENFTNELALTLVIVGLIFIAFSRLKREDELTARIRINALYWAILINYLLYALVVVMIFICDALDLKIGGFLGGFDFYISFTMYNLFTPLVIFTGILYYSLFRNKNEFVDKPIRFLPYKPYRFIGKWLSIMFFTLSITRTFGYAPQFINSEVFYLMPLALLMWAYTKERKDDEYIGSIRLEAMQIAIYVNYTILLIANWLVYGLDFWTVLNLNLITIPLIYIAWFQYKLYRVNKQTETKTLAS